MEPLKVGDQVLIDLMYGGIVEEVSPDGKEIYVGGTNNGEKDGWWPTTRLDKTAMNRNQRKNQIEKIAAEEDPVRKLLRWMQLANGLMKQIGEDIETGDQKRMKGYPKKIKQLREDYLILVDEVVKPTVKPISTPAPSVPPSPPAQA